MGNIAAFYFRISCWEKKRKQVTVTMVTANCYCGPPGALCYCFCLKMTKSQLRHMRPPQSQETVTCCMKSYNYFPFSPHFFKITKTDKKTKGYLCFINQHPHANLNCIKSLKCRPILEFLGCPIFNVVFSKRRRKKEQLLGKWLWLKQRNVSLTVEGLSQGNQRLDLESRHQPINLVPNICDWCLSDVF